MQDIFDRGWIEFVKQIRKANKKSNARLFRLLYLIKGKEFGNDLHKLMGLMKESHSRLRVARRPEGTKFKENRVPGIPEIWVTMKSTSIYGQVPEGKVYVQVKPERWVYFHYTLTK